MRGGTATKSNENLIEPVVNVNKSSMEKEIVKIIQQTNEDIETKVTQGIADLRRPNLFEADKGVLCLFLSKSGPGGHTSRGGSIVTRPRY